MSYHHITINTCRSMIAVVYLTPSQRSSLLITLINFGSTVMSIIVWLRPTWSSL